MKKNKIAYSLIEVMIVLTILSMWIVWTYSFFSKSRAFLDWVSAKIEAIEIAREGIEALENIRNTNWLRFSANIDDCWDTLNYDSDCISWAWNKIWWNVYILENKNWLWNLKSTRDSTIFQKKYHNLWVWKDVNTWKYCQTLFDDVNCITKWVDWKTIIWTYTRKIKVENIWLSRSNPSKVTKIKVTVTVEWIDSSKSWFRKIELVNLMTNYKK